MALPSSSLLAAFDASGDAFAYVSNDNRIKVWDTMSGALRQEYTEPGHLTASYTCFAWSPHSPLTSGASKIKSKKSKQSSLGLAAVGTDSGLIVVWDLQKGEVIHRLGAEVGGHTARVNDVIFNSSGSVLFSCGEDKQIREWNLSEGTLLASFRGDKTGVKRLALTSDDAMLLSASSSIKLWDLSSRTVMHKYTGHARPVSYLRFSADNKYFVSAADDRYLNVWAVSTDSADSEESTRNAIQVLTMESTPVHVELSGSIQGSGKFKKQVSYHALAVTKSGHVHIWNISPANTTVAPLPPHGTVSISNHNAAVKGEAANVLFATFNGLCQVLIAKAPLIKPNFQRLTYCDETDKTKIVREITASPADETSALLPSAEAKVKISKRDATVLSTADMDIDRPNSSANKSTDKDTQSLQQRVEAMNLGVNKPAQLTGTPKASSLQSLLVQAIHANDESLLEHCLSVTDRQTIQNTVRRLPTQHVLPFLTIVMEKFQGKPNRGIQLSSWIKSVLTQHSSYLMSVPDLVRTLSPLYQTIDLRLSVFKKLLKLYGRLDLVLTQISAKSSALEDEDEEEIISKPLAVYTEGDSDVEEEDILQEEEEDDEDADNQDDEEMDSADDMGFSDEDDT